ncbi:MAG: C40 family peptidase [Burkholderiales bacterium]
MTKRRAVFAALLVASAMASAAPDDPLDRLIAEKGLDRGRLITQLDQVRRSVADTASAVSDKAADLVLTALGFLGVPYKWGGNSAQTGFDCSGFVRAIYEQSVGLRLPRKSDEQAAATETIARSELAPGDLVFFNTARRAFSHVGIYMGDGKFIHSPRTGAVIRVEDLDASYWTERFDGARRVANLSVVDRMLAR